jgi:iron complex outermembrane receptor protein
MRRYINDLKSHGSHVVGRFCLATSAAVLCGVMTPDAGHAQTATQASAAQQSPVEEVLVTARRRAENEERVPLTVTAIGAEELSQRSITTEQDLQAAVPGLVVRETQESNDLSYNIRGQGIDAQSGSRPGVLPYIDDIQINRFTASSLFDLSSVQVLKGPQGTLFGRNTTGGAVLYTTAMPADELSGYVTFDAGNYGLAQARGAANIPIDGDKVLLRIAGNAYYRDGYVTNIYNGQKLGTVESQAGRATLVLQPIESLQNTTVFQYEIDNGTNVSPELRDAYPCGSTNHGIPLASLANASCLYGAISAAYLATHPKIAANPILAAQGIDGYIGIQRALGPYRTEQDNPSTHRSHNFYVANTTTYDLNSDLQIKNIFGAASSSSHDSTDLDGSPFGVIMVRNNLGQPSKSLQETDQISDEIQILGKALAERLDYTVGAYYSNERDKSVLPVNVFDIVGGAPNSSGFDLGDTTEAVYGQGTYDLSDMIEGLSFTGGVRYTWETNSITQTATSPFFKVPGVAQHQSLNVSEPSWTVGLQEQVNPDLMFYVETRGSFRSAGFNGITPPVGNADVFLPEKTHDVEAGMKFSGQIFGVDSRLNVAAYDQWVSNVQRAVYTIIPGASIGAVTVNVPDAEIRGFEVDAIVAPTSWLEFGGNGAYTDAAYTNGHVVLFGAPTTFGPYADVPRWSGSVYGQIHFPVPEGWGDPVLRADLFAQTKSYYSNLANTIAPFTSLPGYGLLNLRVDWHGFIDKNATLSVFDKNVTSQRYDVGGLALGNAFGINGVIPGAPAMYGVELNYTF